MADLTIAPHPRYEIPQTLRLALSEGSDISAIDADRIARLVAGSIDADEVKRLEVLHRHMVTAALRGDHRYCMPFGSEEAGYTYQWPTQEHLNGDQWWADLLSEPATLLDIVLDRLPAEQRAYIDRMVAEIRTEREAES